MLQVYYITNEKPVFKVEQIKLIHKNCFFVTNNKKGNRNYKFNYF